MSTEELREGRRLVRLGDVVTRTSKRCTPELSDSIRWIGADHLDEGDLSVRRWSTTDDPMFPPTFYFAVPSGSVLLHSRNPKKVAILPFDAITGEKMFCLSPVDKTTLDSRFLAYQLQSDHFHGFVGRWLSGSVNKFLNWTALERYEFALPPIDEQQRIVDLVDAVDRVAEGLRAVDIKVLWRAVLRQALEQATVECPLGEVLSLEYGKGLSEKNRDGGAYQVVGSAGVVGSHSIPLIKEDSVIVVGRKGTAGSVQLINGPCWPIDTTYYVKLKEELPLTFVAAQLSEIGLDALVAGSAVPGLNRDDAYQLRFRLPDPASMARLVSALARLEAASERVLAERERVRLVRLALLNVSMEDKDVR